MDNSILSLYDITKEYPGLKALDDVTVSFIRGETHALVGENGAGKSTLIKTLSGAIIPEKGKIVIDGNEYDSMNPRLAMQLGIAVIYQEFNLMPTLSVAENLFIGDRIGGRVLIDRKEMERRAAEIFKRMKVDINPKELVCNLSVAYMQLVEIAKALSKNVKILVMDEPTAPLTSSEVEILFDIVKTLKSQGVTIIYISHRLNEIFRVADRVTVLRDGKVIETSNIKDITREDLIRAMVGREIDDTYPTRDLEKGDVILKVDHLSGNRVKDANFEVHRGEIFGLSGLVGAGRTELVRMIFGADKKDSGTIYLDGEIFDPRSPRDSVRSGVGLIPEDRKQQGVVVGLPIQWNITLSILKRISKASVINRDKENAVINELIKSLKIKTPTAKQLVKNLSGGNQQKVVLAKWLAVNCKVLIFDEPTRGIDVDAKQEIYKLMNNLCAQGIGIIMISSDMEEIIGMSDRILVLCEGQQTGLLNRNEFTQEAILSYASGNN